MELWQKIHELNASTKRTPFDGNEAAAASYYKIDEMQERH